MRNLSYYAAAAVMVLLAYGAAAAGGATKKAPSKKSAASSAGAAKKKSAAAAKTRRASSRRGKTTTRRKTTTTWRNRQAAPSPERYKEIQQALAAKGYLKPEEVNGTWGDSSVDALKRFQSEQNLESTGKINSLSLIALGLGPRRETPSAPRPPTPDPSESGK